METQFYNSDITRDKTKYNTIVGVIDSDILSCVSDIVLNPPPSKKYVTIKERLIKRFAKILND